MNISQTAKKGYRNVASDLLYQILVIVLGIVIPRLFIVSLGSESNGLVASINQILTYVALLEAGVGAASLQALFLPIKDRDQDKISEILSATHHFYQRTGAAYAFVLLLLAVVFPFTVETEMPRLTVSLVVLVSGLPSVISFLFQGKYTILLNAEGKNYLLKSISTVTFILNSILKIVLLRAGCGLVVIQSITLVTAAIQVGAIEIYIHRTYRWINLRTTPDFLAIKQSKNALIHQIAWLVTSNTDTIILTYVCGLKVVSIYTIYRLILGAVDGLIASFLNGVHFAMGQCYQDSVERYKKLHHVYEVFIITLCFSLFCIAGIFILPFLSLYTAGITDTNYMDPVLPYLFVAAHILVQARATSWETISVAGMFRKTQHQPIIEAIINLSVSLVLVFPFGIHGVVLGTVIASSYRVIAMIWFANRTIMNQSIWPTYRRYLINFITFLCLTLLAKQLFETITFTSYWTLFGAAIPVSVAIIGVFFTVVLLSEKNVRAYTKDAIALIKNRG